MVAQPKEDPQSGMFDVVIEDEDYEAAIREWLAMKPTRSELAKIKRRLDEGAERNNIKSLDDGARIRIGAFTAEAKTRQGGGFAMPEWETRGLAGLRPLMAEVE